MSSNLPPGVTEGMIPGNRPEDAMMEQIWDGPIGDALSQHINVAVYYQESLSKIITTFLESVNNVCTFCGGIINPSHYCSEVCKIAERELENE